MIYTFHFYESHLFTLQGVRRGRRTSAHELKGVTFIHSTPENVWAAWQGCRMQCTGCQWCVMGLDRWNAARIDGEIGQVAAWAKHWGVPVECDEFGVYRQNADPKDRSGVEAEGCAHGAQEARHGLGRNIGSTTASLACVTSENGAIATFGCSDGEGAGANGAGASEFGERRSAGRIRKELKNHTVTTLEEWDTYKNFPRRRAGGKSRSLKRRLETPENRAGWLGFAAGPEVPTEVSSSASPSRA